MQTLNFVETLIVASAAQLALDYMLFADADRSVDCGEWSDAARGEQDPAVDAAFETTLANQAASSSMPAIVPGRQ